MEGYLDSFNFYDWKGIGQLKNASQDPKADRALNAVAAQFESLFLNMMLKGLRQANESFESNLLSSSDHHFYRDMLDKQMALSLSKEGGIGLADVIVRQLAKAKGAVEIEPDTHLQKEALNTPIEAPQQTPIPKGGEEFSSPSEFVNRIYPVLEKLNDSQLNSKWILAQAALETGWGQHILKQENGSSTFNLFNIKKSQDWDQPVVKLNALEYKEGVLKPESSEFKVYSTFEHSVQDYLNLLKDRQYQTPHQKTTADDFFQELLDKGYATDPQYSQKLMGVLKGKWINELKSF